jgi:hypothetical protein
VNAEAWFTIEEVSIAADFIALRHGDQSLSARYFVDETALHLWTASRHYEFLPGETRRVRSDRGRSRHRVADSDRR